VINRSSKPKKPVSDRVRPEITKLPELTPGRKFVRKLWRAAARFLVRLLARVEMEGLENFPTEESVLVVSNHLGDADFILGLAFTPRPLEYLAKSELYDFPVLGALLRAYGTIWIHRGTPDRRAIRAAMNALSNGRSVAIAPEGRESLSGSLEEGTQGAAYLALKGDVAILPVTVTGTENDILLNNIMKLRRTPITVTIGKPFRIKLGSDRKESLYQGTEQIMRVLASQLPAEYRGVYQTAMESNDE